MYWGDYLADTGHLSAAEHGAYLLLIAHYWTKGGLPKDERAIQRITKLTPRQWSLSRDNLLSLFGDNWSHKRIDTELAKALEKSRVNSANAKRRHSERKTAAPEPEPEPEPIRKKDDAPRPSEEKRTAEVVPINETPQARTHRLGKPLLISLGVSEGNSGKVIGRWLKEKNDPEGILAALEFAVSSGVAEPISYVTKCLAREPKHEALSAIERIKRMAEEARRIEDSAGIKRSSDSIGGPGVGGINGPGVSSQGKG